MKLFIKNRKGQKLCVLIDKPENQKGLAFVMHGHGKTKDQDSIVTLADVFAKNQYTVVKFDATNTYGESDGKAEDSTTTGYYNDLEDVINWSESQDFYKEPFVLAGKSIGGMVITLFAEKNPKKVKAIIPESAVISGKLSLELEDKKKLAEWKKKGIKEWNSVSEPGVVKRIKYAYFEDKMKYDLLEKADKLTMPVLLIVGDKDTVTPIKHQKLLFEKILGRKEIHIINDATHNFSKKHLNEIKLIVDKWIKSL